MSELTLKTRVGRTGKIIVACPPGKWHVRGKTQILTKKAAILLKLVPEKFIKVDEFAYIHEYEKRHIKCNPHRCPYSSNFAAYESSNISRRIALIYSFFFTFNKKKR